MSSSLIEALAAHRPTESTVQDQVRDGERAGLLVALAVVPDPRGRHGMRYPLASLLAVAVCAVMAGALTFAAIADWVRDLDSSVTARLGLPGRVPAATTLWRLLVRVDAQALQAALTAWLRLRVPAVGGLLVIAIDGKVLRGARLPDGGQVHLLSAYDTGTGIVLAQVQIAARSNEIPAFAPLLDQVTAQIGSLAGAVIVADALHAQTAHARDVAARGAHLLVAVKANQPTTLTQLKALPWAQLPPGDRTRESGHGRRETRTIKTVTVGTPGGLTFAHAQQAVRITRTRTVKGKVSRETAYLVISLPAHQAHPAQIQDWARREWHIENRIHWVRDVTFREDAHQARTGTGPAVAAVLRNTAIGFHRSNGEPNIARATRRANRRPQDLIDAVTRSYPITQ